MMLEWVKIFRAVGMLWEYFARKKDLNWGWAGMECYRLNVVSLQNPYVEILNPNVIILRRGTIGRSLGWSLHEWD